MSFLFSQKIWIAICLVFTTVSLIFAQKNKPEVIVQTGQGSVSIMKISHDGKLLAVVGGGNDGIYLWNISSLKLIRVIDTQRKSIKDLSFSYDNRSLATVSADQVATIWDLATGSATFFVKVGRGRGIDFSPDGKFLALSPRDGEGVVLFDIDKQIVVKKFGGSSSPIFSPDGKILYSKDLENIYAWDVKNGQQIFSFRSNKANFSLSLDGKKLAVSSGETVTVIGAKTGNEIADIVTQGKETLVFTADGNGLITKLDDRKIGLWDVSQKDKSKIYLDKTKGFVGEFEKIQEFIEAAVVTPDGTNLITGHQSGLKIWDIENRNFVSEFGKISYDRYQTQISPDGKSIFLTTIESFSNRSFFWNTEINGLPLNFKQAANFSKPILMFNPNRDNLIISAYDSGSIFKSDSLEEAGTFSESFVSFSPNGKMFLTKSQQGNDKISIRDAETGILTRRLEGSENFKGSRAEFAFDKKSKTIGALEFGTFSGFYVWESETGKPIKKIDLPEWWWGNGGVYGSAIALNLDAKIFAGNTTDRGGGILDGKRRIPIIVDSFESFSNAKSVNDLKTVFTDLGSISSMFFSSDGKVLIVQGNNNRIVEFINVENGEVLGKIVNMPDSTSISLSENGKRLIVWGRTSGVGVRSEVTIYEVPSGELALTIRGFNDGNWIAYSPDGYYQASSDKVFGRLSWRVGTQVYDFERFYERYYKPDLIGQVFGSKKVESNAKTSIAQGFAIPPEVKISTPENVKSTTSESIALTVKATDQGGGIKDLRLYQNNKRLSEKQRGIVQPKENSIIFNVSLIPGKNVFRATAYSTDQTESEPFELTIERKAQAGKSDLYILAVGINVYKNAKYNLNYAGADALALSDAIEKKGQGIFGNVYKTLITDGLATRAGIEKAFKEIALKAKPQDSFVFFYAGHGILIDGESDTNKTFYLVPHDVTQITTVGGGELTNKGISSELLRDWTTQIKAAKQLMMLDACQSGGAIEAFATRGLAEEKAMSQLARSAGIVVLTASGTEQQAIEFKKLGHGVFTYAILKGLAGEADSSPSDRIITVGEIETFLDRKVPELTKEFRGTTQYPQRYSRGQDFPLGTN
jgi:WD40 repeat protein